MDSLKKQIENLLQTIKSNKKLDEVDQRRIAEKVLWLEKEIRIFSATNPLDIPTDSISERLNKIF